MDQETISGSVPEGTSEHISESASEDKQFGVDPVSFLMNAVDSVIKLKRLNDKTISSQEVTETEVKEMEKSVGVLAEDIKTIIIESHDDIARGVNVISNVKKARENLIHGGFLDNAPKDGLIGFCVGAVRSEALGNFIDSGLESLTRALENSSALKARRKQNADSCVEEITEPCCFSSATNGTEDTGGEEFFQPCCFSSAASETGDTGGEEEVVCTSYYHKGASGFGFSLLMNSYVFCDFDIYFLDIANQLKYTEGNNPSPLLQVGHYEWIPSKEELSIVVRESYTECLIREGISSSQDFRPIAFLPDIFSLGQHIQFSVGCGGRLSKIVVIDQNLTVGKVEFSSTTPLLETIQFLYLGGLPGQEFLEHVMNVASGKNVDLQTFDFSTKRMWIRDLARVFDTRTQLLDPILIKLCEEYRKYQPIYEAIASMLERQSPPEM